MELTGCTGIPDHRCRREGVSVQYSSEVNSEQFSFYSVVLRTCFLSLSSCRHLKRALFLIRKVVKYYTIFGVVNLFVLIIMPVLRNVHELPFLMWTPYDIQKSLPFFYFMYAFHCGNAFFAGGGNLAVNMFVYSTLVVMEFILHLLGARMKRLGYGDGQPINTNLNHKVSYYREVIYCVKMHLRIDR